MQWMQEKLSRTLTEKFSPLLALDEPMVRRIYLTLAHAHTHSTRTRTIAHAHTFTPDPRDTLTLCLERLGQSTESGRY